MRRMSENLMPLLKPCSKSVPSIHSTPLPVDPKELPRPQQLPAFLLFLASEKQSGSQWDLEAPALGPPGNSWQQSDPVPDFGRTLAILEELSRGHPPLPHKGCHPFLLLPAPAWSPCPYHQPPLSPFPSCSSTFLMPVTEKLFPSHPPSIAAAWI